MIVLSLFDGMACGLTALKRAGIPVTKYYASEIDKYAIQIAKKNHPEIEHIGDVEGWREWDIESPDLIIGGSPCQDISGLKNNGKGINGEKSKLLNTFADIKNYYKPKYFLLENVIPRKKEWKFDIDNIIGVKGVEINSDLFTQQNRPRIYWVNWTIPELPARPNWCGDFYQYRRTYYRKNKSGVCPCLTANMGTGGHNVPLHLPDKDKKLTPIECERLQTLPDDYTEGVSNSQRYKMLGNGWTVDVIAHILKGLK